MLNKVTVKYLRTKSNLNLVPKPLFNEYLYVPHLPSRDLERIPQMQDPVEVNIFLSTK